MTVTATQVGDTLNGIGLTVVVVTGQNTSNPIGTTAASGTVTAPELAITPSGAGNWVYGAIFDAGGSPGAAFAPLANTTFSLNVRDTPHLVEYGTFRSAAATTTSSTTYGATSPTNTASFIGIAMVEIIGAALAEDASSPAPVSTTAATTITTASFTPPGGALLVAQVASDTQGGGTNPMTTTVTDSSGLTWTQQVAANEVVGSATYQCASVWTAVVPGGAAASAAVQVQRGGRTWRHRFRRRQQPFPPLPATTVPGAVSLAGAGSLIAGGTVSIPPGLAETVAAAWAGSSTTSRTNLITSASFTPTANSLLVVVTGSGNVNGVAQTGVTVTDSVSGTWTQLVRKTVSGSADASVWVKDAGSFPSAQTVTVTMAPATILDVGAGVRQFTGAAPAASQTGATGVNSGTVDTVSVTPTATGSQIIGAFGNGTGTTVTANAATTLYGQTPDTGGAVNQGGFEGNALTTAGTAQVLGYTATQAGSALAAAEILANPAVAGTATLTGAGSLTAGATLNAGAALDAAGTLPAAVTQNAGAALDAAGALTAAGVSAVSGAAALIGTGSLSSLATIAPAKNLDAAGSLTAGSTIAPAVALDAAGSLTAAPGASWGAVLDGAGSLSASAAIAPAVSLDAAGSLFATATQGVGSALTAAGFLSPVVIQSIGASLDAAGFLSGVGSAVGANLQGTGTLTASGQSLLTPVQIAHNSITTGTTCAVTITASTAGNTLVAIAYSGGTTITSVKSGTNTDNWADRTNQSNASIGCLAIWSDPLCAAGATTINVVQGTSGPLAVFVYELPGNCVLDQTGTGTANAGTSGSTSWTAGTIGTTTTTSEFWIGAVAGFNNNFTSAVSVTTPPAAPWISQPVLDFNTSAYLYVSCQNAQSIGTPTYTGTTNITPATNNFYFSNVVTFTATIPGAAALQGTGSLATAAEIDPVATIIAAGRLATSAIEQPGPLTLAAGGRLTAGATQGSPTPLIGVASLAAVGYSVNAALIGTGTLATAAEIDPVVQLTGTSTLNTTAELDSSAALTGTGTLTPTPGTSGGAAVQGTGTLSGNVTLTPAELLTGAGSLSTQDIQGVGASVIGAGSLTSVGFAVGAVLAGTGSVIANTRLGITALLAGAGSIITAPVASPALEAFGFGTFPQIPAGSAISSVTVVISDWASSSAMNALTFELWDGTSARIGTTQTGGQSTSPYNLDSATFTGVTYAQLATLRVRIFANAGSSAQGDQEMVNSVSLTVAFTPSTNALALPSVLRCTTTFSVNTIIGQHNASAAPVDLIPTFTSFPAVTAGQLSIAGKPAILRCATTFPAVTASGVVNASITVNTLALAGSVVPVIVTATSTGPDYAHNADIVAGTGTGTWTSVTGVIGPPDASEAIWTRP